MNIRGQTGLNSSKQKQIEDFIKKKEIDVLHCQEINIEDTSFSTCNFIAANYNIISNNAINGNGTASIVKHTKPKEGYRRPLYILQYRRVYPGQCIFTLWY